MKDSFLKTLLDAHIAPVLAEHGFKRRKSTWNRRVDGIVHVIHFHAGKGFAPHESEQFQVEVGVAVDAVTMAVEGKVPRFYTSCITVTTIGYLRSADDQKFDKWWWDLWWLKSEADIPRAVAEIIDDLHRYVLPTLDRIKSPQEVRDFVMMVETFHPRAPMLPYVKLGLAALCYIMGDCDEYERLKSDLIHGKGKGPRYDPGRDPWPKKMTEVAARLETNESVSGKRPV